MVSIGSAKGTDWDHGPFAVGVSFNIVFGVLKTLEAWVILLIKVTFMPTPISSITNGMVLEWHVFPRLLLECLQLQQVSPHILRQR